MLLGTYRASLGLAIVLGLCGPAFGADLLEVYDLARQSDPQLQVSDEQRLAISENAVQARAALLPSVNGQAILTDGDNSSSSLRPFERPDGSLGFGSTNYESDTRNRSYRVTLDQAIYDHARFTRTKSAKELSSKAEADYKVALDNLFIRVAEAYFNVLTAQANLEAAETEEKAVGRQLEQADQRFEVGLTAITDVHEARARSDAAKANAILSRTQLEDAFEALTELTGQPVEHVVPMAESVPLESPDPANAEAWVEVALENSPALASRRHAVASAEYDIKTARAGHYPSLLAQAEYGDNGTWGSASVNGFAQPPGSESDNASVSIILNVPLFSGFATRSKVRQSIYLRDVAEDLLEQDKRAVVRQTRNAFRSAVAGISEVEARKQALVSAQSAMEATQAGFEVGTRTIVDTLLSQQQLFAAQREYARARHNFIVSGLRLKQSAGVIDVKDIQLVNTLLSEKQ